MGIYLKRFEHESVRVGTLREEEKLRMDLDTSKLSVIWIACRFDDDPDSKLYQLQGFAPDEQSAIALCRGSEYFYFGPVPFNCALPHTAFRLPKIFPFKSDTHTTEEGAQQ
jgi:hypothetical protein